MSYDELVDKVKRHSGLSEPESKDALEMLVESLSVHLPERERLLFAQYLPERLQVLALSVMPTVQNSRQDIVSQFMMIQKISRSRAKRQIKSAWQALKDTIKSAEFEGHLAKLTGAGLIWRS